MTVDGGTVSMRSRSQQLNEPWFQTVMLRDSRLGSLSEADELSISVGPLGAVDEALRLMNGAVLNEAPLGSGLLLLAEGTDPAGELLVGVAWIGDWHSAYGLMPAGSQTMSDARALFGTIRPTDTPDGLVIDPNGRVVSRHYVSRMIPKAGMVTLQPRTSAPSEVPKWTGHVIDVGELWRVPIEGDVESLLLITPTVRASISPFDTRGAQVAPGAENYLAMDGRNNSLEFVESLSELSWVSA